MADGITDSMDVRLSELRELVMDRVPTQESNQGLLHCRRILYQLSYQGGPKHQNEGQKVYFLTAAISKAAKK